MFHVDDVVRCLTALTATKKKKEIVYITPGTTYRVLSVMGPHKQQFLLVEGDDHKPHWYAAFNFQKEK